MKILLCCLALISFSFSLSNELVSVHEQDEVRRTTIHLVESSSLVKAVSLTAGQPAFESIPSGEVRTHEVRGTFLDTFQKVKRRGRPLAFSRKYSSLSDTTSTVSPDDNGGAPVERTSHASALENAEVNFKRWAGGFKASYPQGSARDRDLLAGLEALLPFERLLPGRDVDLGSEWEVDVEVLWSMMKPGGDLAFVYENRDMDALRKALAEVKHDTELDGEVTASLVRVEGGAVTIGLEVTISEFVDLTEINRRLTLAEIKTRAEREELPDIERADRKALYEGEGTLLWDLPGGRARSLELSLKTTVVHSDVYTVVTGGDRDETESTRTREGELTLSIQVERVPTKE